MVTKRNRIAATAALVFYTAVSLLFPLTHTDGISFGGVHSISAAGAFTHPHDSDSDGSFCPAHQFAISTTGTPVTSFSIFSPTQISFLIVSRHLQLVVVPTRNLSSRAPPQA
jgi:hypothetical protein